MKKFVSVALATAMIASLGVTAFAKDNYKADVKNVSFLSKSTNGSDELYFPLYVSKVKDATDSSDKYLIADDENQTIKAVEIAQAKVDKYTAEVTAYGKVTGLATTWTTDLPTSLTKLKEEIAGKLGKDADKYTLALPDSTGVETGTWTAYVAKAEKVYTDAKDTADANLKQAEAELAEAQKLQLTDVIAYDDIEDIDDLKVTLKLTSGEDYVADYYIDEIDDEAAPYDGFYAIVLELNDNYTTSKQKIKGTVTLKNKTKKLEEVDFSYNHGVTTVEVKDVDTDGIYGPNTELGITEMEFDGEDAYINLVEFSAKANVAKFTKEVENIELEDNNGFYFDVKASDQGKLNLTYDNVAIKSVTRVAPADADLSFFNFYGYPEFDFTGTVTLTPEEDDVEYFIYKVAKDGKISKVNAKLNEDGDAYEFKTRTLGCYVMSDMELDIDEVNAGETTPEDKPADGEGTPAPEAGKPNPGTGL